MEVLSWRSRNTLRRGLILRQIVAEGAGAERCLKSLPHSRRVTPKRASASAKRTFWSIETLAGFDATPSIFLLAPRKVSAEQTARLESATLQALSSPELQAVLSAQGATASPLGSTALKDWLAREDARWAQVVTKAGISLD